MGVSTAKKAKKLDPRVERLLRLIVDARRAREGRLAAGRT